jgi:hypothetical protein
VIPKNAWQKLQINLAGVQNRFKNGE